MWNKGTIETAEGIRVDYDVKHYGEGSDFGIDGGKISKLEMTVNGEIVAHYERGWDIRPDKENKNIMAVYQEILKKYN
ncbi:MAG: hypothetical protein IJR34_04240 [Bacteroidales bacterium]|nr:hypothetical protein [Bacteroidales bacterium]